jgi:hypothetical protein
VRTTTTPTEVAGNPGFLAPQAQAGMSWIPMILLAGAAVWYVRRHRGG